MDCGKIAAALYEAEKTRRPVDLITSACPQLTVAEAYGVQLAGVALKVDDGHRVLGLKIGFTSRSMQELLKISEPACGHLTDQMLWREGQPVSMSRLNQPKVEGEVAFCLGRPLKGPGLTVADVYLATAYICPAIEIVDSRFANGPLTMLDSVADNNSAAGFVLGGRMTRPDQVDLRLTGMILEKNGELINSGCGAEIMGHPAAAVAWLGNKLSTLGLGLEAGQIVMSGALTAPLPAAAGDSFTASFGGGLGSVTVRFTA